MMCKVFPLVFLLVINAFSFGQETTTRIEATTTTNNAVQVLAGPLVFESNKIYYVHPEALTGVTQITLDGLQNTEVHFLGSFSGSVKYWVTYGDNIGVLNITDCQNLRISGLDVENTYVFQTGNLIQTTSVAVNVSRSSVTIDHSTITSNGKSALLVHSGSNVTINDSTINAYYFELHVGASTVVAKRVIFNQDHVDPDSHSAIWVGSSTRNGVTNILYEGTNVVLEDITFNMANGRSIVTGNGSYTTMSNVTLVRPVFNITDPTKGIVTWHENYNSITVVFDEVSGLIDYVSTPNVGFARFVNYYSTPTRPNSNAPIIVDGVSSENITP